MKTVKAATIEQNNWKQEMQKFLRQYRATPHSTTGITQQIVIQQGPQPKITNHINCYSQFNIIKLFSRLSSNFRIFWISEFSFVIRIFRGCTSWLEFPQSLCCAEHHLPRLQSLFIREKTSKLVSLTLNLLVYCFCAGRYYKRQVQMYKQKMFNCEDVFL